MKFPVTAFLIFLLTNSLFAQKKTVINTNDIDNFWKAYDKITATKDSAQQYQFINDIFIDKGSPGLKGIMKARNYTARSYVEAINRYPKFWTSIRPNTLQASGSTKYVKSVNAEIRKFRKLYPAIKPAGIYFTIGVLRTGGTALDSMVLIGSEIALADRSADTSEFPSDLSHLRSYFDADSLHDMIFTIVHEYVHTQQKTTIGNNLLAQSVLEGIAEFLAVKVTGKGSPNPPIAYGKQHDQAVKDAFTAEMFSPHFNNWLWNNTNNRFGMRDLGYYTGYAISEKYYEKANDKAHAIKEMIELDYNDEAALEKFVNESGYFSKDVATYKEEFEENRPFIVSTAPIENGPEKVSPAITRITLTFSTAMDKRFRNFNIGPAGEAHIMRVEKVVGFSDDGKSFTFEVKLVPNQLYQLVIGEGFRSAEGIPLKPYLIEFNTGE